MASREERLQQRLRGANTRHIGDVNFGLVFAPVAPARSPTPQPEAQSTSQALPAQLPTRRITTNVLQAAADISSSTPNAQKQHIHNANTSAKLRKLDTNPLLSSRSTRSSQKTPRPDIYTLIDDSLPKADDVSINAPLSESHIDDSILSDVVARQSTPVRAVEEVTESPLSAPGSGRRTRTIERIALTSSRLQNLLVEDVETEEGTSPAPQRKRKRKESAISELSPDLSQELTAQATATNEADLNELSPEQPVRGSKRRRRVAEPSPEPEVDDQAEAEEIDDEQAALVLQENRRRRSSRIAPVASPELDLLISPVAKKRKGKPRVDSSPVQQRQPKANPRNNHKANPMTKRQPSNLKPKRLGSPIPVTVHRLTKGVVYDDDEQDADILNTQIARPKRGDPNIMDVLSQVCQEIVTSTLELLEETGNKSEDATFRRELKTKWDGVEAFGRELQTRLLEHTINLDNRDSLQRRLRDEQKRKLDLREQISFIRAEREQVAFSMDKVRIQHENETAKALSRDSLNNAVQDIELAIDLGKSSQNDSNHEMIGTEFLLKRIAGQVSNKDGSGGLLRQLKEANAFLERAALFLEGRKI